MGEERGVRVVYVSRGPSILLRSELGTVWNPYERRFGHRKPLRQRRCPHIPPGYRLRLEGYPFHSSRPSVRYWCALVPSVWVSPDLRPGEGLSVSVNTTEDCRTHRNPRAKGGRDGEDEWVV